MTIFVVIIPKNLNSLFQAQNYINIDHFQLRKSKVFNEWIVLLTHCLFLFYEGLQTGFGFLYQ